MFAGELTQTPYMPAPFARGLPIAILIAAVLAVVLQRRVASLPGPLGRNLAVVSLAALPSLLVMPKATYSLPLLLLCVLFIVRNLEEASGALSDRFARLELAQVTLLALVPVLAWILATSEPGPRSVERTIAALRRTWDQRPAGGNWRMLEADGGWCTYLDIMGCVWVQSFLHTPGVTFAQVLERQNVNAVLVTPRLLGAGWEQEPAFRRFTHDPGAFVFRRIWSNGWATLYLRAR